jgi:hypothetical protein
LPRHIEHRCRPDPTLTASRYLDGHFGSGVQVLEEHEPNEPSTNPRSSEHAASLRVPHSHGQEL